MGLSVSFDCFRASYSTFSEMRKAIAVAAGYPLSPRNFNGYQMTWWTLPDEDKYTADNYTGQWEPGQPADPLMVLLVHADDGGVIVHRHTGPLADRLEGLLPLLPSEEEFVPEEFRKRTYVVKFIAGLRRAHAAGRGVRFS